MVARVIPVDPFDLVIFGGSGDLARRKILPGLFRRFRDGQITADSCIIGAARGEMTDADYRQVVRDAISEFGGIADIDQSLLEAFLKIISYVSVDAKGTGGWGELAAKMRLNKVHVF